MYDPLAEVALTLRQTTAIFWDTKKSPVGGGISRCLNLEQWGDYSSGEPERRWRDGEMRESVEGRISCCARGEVEGFVVVVVVGVGVWSDKVSQSLQRVGALLSEQSLHIHGTIQPTRVKELPMANEVQKSSSSSTFSLQLRSELLTTVIYLSMDDHMTF